MEENKLKTRKYALKFGAIAGIISLIFSLMLFFQEMHYEQNAVVTIIGISILFAVIAFGINQFKKDNEGFLKLGQAVKLGAGVGLIAAIIGTIWFLVLSNVIEPDYMTNLMELEKVKAFDANPKLTQEQWDQGVAFQEKLYPVFLAVGLIIWSLFGLIVGLITGLITKKDQPAY